MRATSTSRRKPPQSERPPRKRPPTPRRPGKDRRSPRPNGQTWFLYVLECRDGSLYTGVSTDVARRLHEHNHTTKGSRFVRSRRPARLLRAWKHPSQRAALQAEHRFKALRRQDKLRRLGAKRRPE